MIRYKPLAAAFLAASVIFSPAPSASGDSFIIKNTDDGTEVNRFAWYPEGFKSNLNRIGNAGAMRFDAGLRFHVPELSQGDEAVFARLVFNAMGGEVSSPLNIRIRGVLQGSTASFSQAERPSLKFPKTRGSVEWTLNTSWGKGNQLVPLNRYSPDIAPIINEILSLPDWGSGAEKTLIITLSDESEPGSGYIEFCDYKKGAKCIKTPARLEVYRTVYDTFVGKEMPGRVTDDSAAVSLHALIATDTYIEYGTAPGSYAFKTRPYLFRPAGKRIEIRLEPLTPDTRYYYRLAYRRSGDPHYQFGEERSFHTQRSKDARFTFTVTSDEHIQTRHMLPPDKNDIALYKITLDNIGKDHPDFHLSLGDFTETEFLVGRDILDVEEGIDRYLLQRSYLQGIGHSIPFFLALGNHEGEEGWHVYNQKNDKKSMNLAFLSTLARKAVLNNPHPDGFYSGNEDYYADFGLREDHYAWEWGDALFVVLDPFWPTTKKPFGSGAEAGWFWTLGKTQYDWLHDTLSTSRARWRFIFMHHLVSTSIQYDPYYGRGGIEVAKYKVDQQPSFEWGGEDASGAYIFDLKRPGWSHGAIHDLLVREGVSVVFHGHDHFFAKQDLDGIVYQECPQPGDAMYKPGFHNTYKNGVFLPNSGHLRVMVTAESVFVDYVRAFLPGHGPNGQVAYSYVIR